MERRQRALALIRKKYEAAQNKKDEVAYKDLLTTIKSIKIDCLGCNTIFTPELDWNFAGIYPSKITYGDSALILEVKCPICNQLHKKTFERTIIYNENVMHKIILSIAQNQVTKQKEVENVTVPK